MSSADPNPSPSGAAATQESPWSIPRGLILLLGGAGGFVVMFGLQAFRGIVGPTFLALMLVVTVIPIQQWMLRKGWPK